MLYLKKIRKTDPRNGLKGWKRDDFEHLINKSFLFFLLIMLELSESCKKVNNTAVKLQAYW